MASRCTNERGFTLIEMLIAMFIFGIGMLGIMGMQVTSIQSNGRADTLMVAASMASLALEETLVQPGAFFAVNSEGVMPPINVIGVAPLVINRKITVVTPAVPGTDSAGMARVEIVVTDANNRRVSTCGYKRFVL